MYLTGAQELRGGVAAGRGPTAPLDFVRNTPTSMLLDLLAVRLDPEKAKDGQVSVDLVFPDRKERFRVRVKHAVLTYEANPAAGTADAVYTLPRSQFLVGALTGGDLIGVETQLTGRIGLGRFGLRRLYRLFPALLVTYGTSTDFFFSGHTSIAVYGATELARRCKAVTDLPVLVGDDPGQLVDVLLQPDQVVKAPRLHRVADLPDRQLERRLELARQWLDGGIPNRL